MLEIIALIAYSVGLVGLGMFLGYDLRKFMESEDK
jgi:hypothetical protein